MAGRVKPIPVPVILAAVNGDEDALAAVVAHYQSYIRALATRPQKNGRLLAQLHGSLTPAHACGYGAQCFVSVQRTSIFNLPCMSSPAGRHACFAASVYRSLPVGRSWRTGRMARYRTERIRLPYTAPAASRRAFFVKVRQASCRTVGTVKGRRSLSQRF